MNPTQFKNRNKYMHIIDDGDIIILNRNTQDMKVVFDYEEVHKYLEINNISSGILDMYCK